MNFNRHEAAWRGDAALERLAQAFVTICGVGAVGSNLAESLARTGARRLRVIDRDRIEEGNLATQPWYRADVGTPKVRVLSNVLYRAVGVTVEAENVELNLGNVKKLLKGADLVVDAFDNSASRQWVADHCREGEVACLHIGLAAGYAEVMWNDGYRVPPDPPGDVCDHPLARNLVMLAVSVGAEAIIEFLATGQKRNWSLTLTDLRIELYQ
ncbi:MAG TPA: ThiF family adenylyltransferase [Candidatus Xenobia bacterium]